MLERVANLLIEIKHELLKAAQVKKNRFLRMKPLILAIKDKEKSCYYVLGTNGQDNNRADTIMKNSFGYRFKKAAEQAKVRYSCNSFESSLIEIFEADFDTFLDNLIK